MRIKLSRLLPAVCLSLCLLTGCAGLPSGKSRETPTEKIITYQKLPLPDLFISIPEGYQETSSQFYDTYYLKDDASIIITEDKDAHNTQSKDYAVSALNQYMSVTKELDMINDEVVYADAQHVQLLEFTYRITEDDTPMTTMAAFATDGETMYIITCKSRADTYEFHREEFLTAVQSIRIDKSYVGKGTENEEEE